MENHTQTKSYSYHFLSIFLTTLIFMLYTQPISATSKLPKPYTNFIVTSCRTTTYPLLCTRTLSPYASSVRRNQVNLCNRALSIAIQAANNASSFVTKMAKLKGLRRIELAAIKDCIYDMRHCVYDLRLTVGAVAKLKGSDRKFQWSNAKTWASAAITDTDSCMDGFKGRKVNQRLKIMVRNSMTRVEKRISIALALINHLNV